MRLNAKKSKALTATASGHIIGELRKLDARGLLKQQGGRSFIKCPFHQENTPSLMLTTNTSSSYPIGSWKCWGCGQAGNWNKLASAIGVAPIGEDNAVAKIVQTYDPSFYDNLLVEKYSTYGRVLEDLLVSSPQVIPDSFVWRTLPGSYLKQVGACLVTGTRDKLKYVFLPNYMNEELVGGIRAVITDTGEKSLIKYKNSSGLWSKSKGLYPYDPVCKALDVFEKEHGFRGLCLVEGARDSLVLNCEGMPTLGLLGTQSWGPLKLDNILDLGIDFCLVVMDGDTSGKSAEEKVWTDVKRLVACRKMNLSRFNKQEGHAVDPGNASENVLEEVWNSLMRRKAQT